MLIVIEPLRRIDPERRRQVVDALTGALQGEADVAFAYMYGSAVDADAIHDVDVGVHLSSFDRIRAPRRAVDLSVQLSEAVGLPVDVRVVNEAPVTFLYHVVRGRLLARRDEELRTQVLERTIRDYLDIAPLLRAATREAFVR